MKIDNNKVLFKEKNFLTSNIKYGIIGILIGLIICIFNIVFSSDQVPARYLVTNILYSFFITLSISNVITFFQINFTTFINSFWKLIVGYYICNFIGMVIGVELANLIVAIIFNLKFKLLDLSCYSFSVIMVVIVGTLLLLYQLQKFNANIVLNAKEADLAKLNQLKSQADLQALQSKINPHFLYNALNSITSLIHEDADKAEEMTLKLSKLFRYSTNSMQENFITIKDEIEILNTYLDIEKIRFGNRVSFKVTVEDQLKEKQIPRFLLQPLVENALKHGLKDRSENGEVKVNLQQKNNQIEIYIFDNGAPFPDELIAGYGLQSTFDKLSLLYQENYDLQINNLHNKHIKISIPLV